MSALLDLQKTVSNITFIDQQLAEVIAESKELKAQLAAKDAEITELRRVNELSDSLVNHWVRNSDYWEASYNDTKSNLDFYKHKCDKQEADIEYLEIKTKFYKRQRDDAETMLMRAEENNAKLTSTISDMQNRMIELYSVKCQLECQLQRMNNAK